jgi:uncharacterized protein YjiS (DUF1127 family)
MARTLNASLPPAGPTPSPVPPQGLLAQMRAAGQALVALYKTDRARRRLAKLDDYMLDDIGIDPKTIRREPPASARRF